MTLQAQTLGEDDPATLRTAHELAEVLEGEGKLAEVRDSVCVTLTPLERLPTSRNYAAQLAWTHGCTSLCAHNPNHAASLPPSAGA